MKKSTWRRICLETKILSSLFYSAVLFMDGSWKTFIRDAMVKDILFLFLRLIMGNASADILQLSGKQTREIWTAMILRLFCSIWLQENVSQWKIRLRLSNVMKIGAHISEKQNLECMANRWILMAKAAQFWMNPHIKLQLMSLETILSLILTLLNPSLR